MSKPNRSLVYFVRLLNLVVIALDVYFENVCDLDLIYHPFEVYAVLDEIIVGGNSIPCSSIVVKVNWLKLLLKPYAKQWILWEIHWNWQCRPIRSLEQAKFRLIRSTKIQPFSIFSMLSKMEIATLIRRTTLHFLGCHKDSFCHVCYHFALCLCIRL